jgi:hypothetical protein
MRLLILTTLAINGTPRILDQKGKTNKRHSTWLCEGGFLEIELTHMKIIKSKYKVDALLFDTSSFHQVHYNPFD